MGLVAGKTFFVTGGAGFVGSNMCELLIKKGAKVIVYDNLSNGKREFIKHLEGNGLSFIQADLLDLQSIEAAMSGKRIDAVIHLAANSDISQSMKKTDVDLNQGTIATYNTLEAARKNGVKDVLFSSSSVVYGVANVLPTPENYGPLRPISLYGASKLAAEGLITSFSHLFKMNYYIFRFANVVGRNSTHGVSLDFKRKLEKNPGELEVLGDGKQRKSYIDVEDLTNAMLQIYENSRESENIFNLSTDDQITVEEIAKMVIAKVSPNAGIRYTGGSQGWPGDVPNQFLSNKKMRDFGIELKRKTSRECVANVIGLLTENR